ncbi:MAG: restriction endonuclease subunit S [Chloroflexota bacterium]
MDRVPLRAVVSNPTTKATEPGPFIALEHLDGAMGRLLPELAIGERPAGDSIEFRPGDVLFGKLRPYLAKSLLVTEQGHCSSELLVLRPDMKKLEPRYLAYVVQTHDFVEWANRDSYGVKMPRTSWQALSGFPLPLPSLDEQREIAEQLDREADRIDLLLELAERERRLLRERRRALFNQTLFADTSGTGFDS